MKACIRCGISKPIADFFSSKTAKDGLRSYCKLCNGVLATEWRLRNRDSHNAKQRERYRAKPSPKQGSRSDYLSEWKSANVDKMRGYRKKWADANRSLSRALSESWRKANPQRQAATAAKRRAAKLLATPAWADEAKILEFYQAADLLSMVTGEWHHVDHVVPLRSDLVCGMHVEHNLAVILGVENRRKSNRYWPDMPQNIKENS